MGDLLLSGRRTVENAPPFMRVVGSRLRTGEATRKRPIARDGGEPRRRPKGGSQQPTPKSVLRMKSPNHSRHPFTFSLDEAALQSILTEGISGKLPSSRISCERVSGLGRVATTK